MVFFGIKHSEVANAPRVLVASHMDEVGFMVSEIKPDGTFRVVEIGGWNPRLSAANDLNSLRAKDVKFQSSQVQYLHI